MFGARFFGQRFFSPRFFLRKAAEVRRRFYASQDKLNADIQREDEEILLAIINFTVSEDAEII